MKFYEKTWFIILMLLVFFPVGLFLMWRYSEWNKVVKIIISVICALALIMYMFGGSSDDKKKTEDKPKAQQEQTVDEDAQEETEVTDEKVTEESKSTEKEQSSGDDMDSWSAEQKNCYKAAKQYIDVMPFSRQGLIDQLSSDAGNKYPEDVAEFAVSKLEERGEVDWDEQCEKAAQNYLDTMAFSKDQLIDQLCSDAGSKFTREQAERAVAKVYQ